MAGETSMYLSNFLGQLAAQQEAGKAEERRAKLALEYHQKQIQADQEYESNVYKTWGKNLSDHADVISTDPKERERVKMFGQIMNQTGMPPEVVLNYFKTGISEDVAGIKETLAGLKGQEVGLKAGELKLKQEKEKRTAKQAERRLGQYDRQLGIMQERVNVMREKGEKTPDTIKSALSTYRSLYNKAAGDVSAGRVNDISEALAQYSDDMNIQADIINDYHLERGLPLVPRVEDETVTPGTLGKFFQKFTGYEPTPKKKAAAPGTTEQPKKSAKDRAVELIKANPKWTDKQVRDKLKEEGLVK